jgi:catechol 2,3-dioxygenase-like lactoylglutathione lyase family enzyme
MGLSHVWLLVDDVPRAIGFYRDTLGMELGSDLGEYAEFKVSDEFYLALFTRAAMRDGEPGIAIDPAGGQRAVFAFEVGDLDEYCVELRAKCVSLVSGEANHAAWGLRTAFLHDPDGNLICLYGGILADEQAGE